MVKAQSKRIFELDALRGIAALFVVLFHFTMGRKEGDYGFKFGVTGVDLFFLISGFVILLTLEKTKTWKEFVVNRFSRLYPTYWACVTITTITILIHLGFANNLLFKTLPDYFANLTMFQLYFRRGDIDGSYWTMIIEMLFYIYMLLVFVFKKLKHIELISIICLIFIFIIAHHMHKPVLGIGRLLFLIGFPLQITFHYLLQVLYFIK
jgi:peptidoglycan/LPS O-acetylase OafA/YrhL